MFHKNNDTESETAARLDPPPETPNVSGDGGSPAGTSNSHNLPADRNKSSFSATSHSSSRPPTVAAALHKHYLQKYNNISREESKSQKVRSGQPNLQFQHSRTHPSQEATVPHKASYHSNLQRNSTPNRLTSNTNSNNIYQAPSFPSQAQHLSNQHHPHPNHPQPQPQQHYNPNYYQNFHTSPLKQRTLSAGAISSLPSQSTIQRDEFNRNSSRLELTDRDHGDMNRTSTIKEESEHEFEGLKENDLETLSSLERNLPIELSFLIRQQAYCMARMNYLERQIRELKEAAAVPAVVNHHQMSHSTPRMSSTTAINQNYINRTNMIAPNGIMPTAAMTHTKNGNFILSDDSGGEYSRATISDDDELSSLLDQIAKSVRPERNSISQTNSSQQQQQQQQNSHQQVYNHHHHHHQHNTQQRAAATNYSAILGNQQTQQQYAIINPGQIQQQAVPIFIMGSPIAVAHPTSAMNSNVLPGVHFQPEPRYNQYYEELNHHNNYNNSTMSLAHKHPQDHGSTRFQQFDNSILAVEQLVRQKEKRQIKSQLELTDNWLKMRSSTVPTGVSNATAPQHEVETSDREGDKG